MLSEENALLLAAAMTAAVNASRRITPEVQFVQELLSFCEDNRDRWYAQGEGYHDNLLDNMSLADKFIKNSKNTEQ